ncbi:metallophosphoesterase [Mariniflexile ostreae]|uniref:Metallophosphoesterase n=1 Tax=Mariniflexile ostreae TaxID=1520892 RepID=A0ABV5FDB9_9FLAO
MKFLWKYVLSSSVFVLLSCHKIEREKEERIQIAFIADAHFQDIYAHFEDVDYRGIKNPKTGAYVNIRTMAAQLQSTRIFNENYFAFLEALDDIVAKGIKLVALPGDFSDDGQPIHVKGLKTILDDYTAKHGILFFATTGNHDPVKPFAEEAGKTDFLGEGGQEQIITSSVQNLKAQVSTSLKPIITSEIKKWGYKDVLNEMSAFGFYPIKEYLYWETPFSKYTYEDYTFEKAQKQSGLNQRLYAIDAYNKHPDASYLVEPIQGLWLLAIDANVYMPNKVLPAVSHNPKDFSGASIGYNQVLLQKNHLVDWVRKVAQLAKKKGKVLIAFSHYPMVDFNDDASPEMKAFFGENKMHLHRVPKEKVAEVFADAGIQIHFGGHMHINDTGVRTSKKGNSLFNIQTPSLAAYAPAYKILTIHSSTDFEIETVVMKTVKNFNHLFSLYEQEYAYLQGLEKASIWNKEILEAENYKDFTQWHLEELVRLRFLTKDWSQPFLKQILTSTGKDLLLQNIEVSHELEQVVFANNLTLKDFEGWTGLDMIYDFYKLRSADELAKRDMEVSRLKQYELVCNQLKRSPDSAYRLWAKIFDKTVSGLPSDHFMINLKSNSIKKITP